VLDVGHTRLDVDEPGVDVCDVAAVPLGAGVRAGRDVALTALDVEDASMLRTGGGAGARPRRLVGSIWWSIASIARQSMA
jgi:hypothetical protein